MSDIDLGKDIDVKATDSNVVGYWRVVQVDLEYKKEFNNKELFATREEAEANCKECQLEWKKRACDYREYDSIEYQVRFFTLEELAEEKRQKLAEWHTYIRTTYLDPIVPEKFKLCCQKVVTDMLQKVEKLSESELSRLRREDIQYYCPWQSYGIEAKIWAYMRLEPNSQKVSFWGMFVKNSLFGCIHQRIETFDSIANFKAWLSNNDQAAETLEKCMLEALQHTLSSDKYPQG